MMVDDDCDDEHEITVGKETRQRLCDTVHRRGWITVGELAERAGLRPGRVDTAVDKLVENDRVKSEQLGDHRLVIARGVDRDTALAKWFDAHEVRQHPDPRVEYDRGSRGDYR